MAVIAAPPSAPCLRGLHRSQFHLQSKMTLLLSLVRCHLSKPFYDVGCSLRRQRSLTYVCGTLGLRHFLLSKARTSLPARVGQRYGLEALTITAAAQISIHEFKDTLADRELRNTKCTCTYRRDKRPSQVQRMGQTEGMRGILLSDWET